jgi:hypothetical protein
LHSSELIFPSKKINEKRTEQIVNTFGRINVASTFTGKSIRVCAVTDKYSSGADCDRSGLNLAQINKKSCKSSLCLPKSKTHLKLVVYSVLSKKLFIQDHLLK